MFIHYNSDVIIQTLLKFVLIHQAVTENGEKDTKELNKEVKDEAKPAESEKVSEKTPAMV